MFVALAIALALATAPASVRAHSDGSYPRTLNLDWNNTINAYYMSRYDLVSLSTRLQNVQLDSLRALNPSIKRLVATSYYIWFFAGPSGYPYQWGPYDAADPVYGWDRKFWDLLQNNNWWMYAVDSTGTRYHASMAFNMWMGNFTSHCPKNAQGKRLCDVYADFLCDNLLAGKHFDGVFFDYCSKGIAWMSWNMYGNCDYNQNCLDPNVAHTPDTKYRSAFDCDGDGRPDNPDSLDSWWRQGMDVIHNRLRQRLGADAVIVGNGNQQYPQLNGAMIESFPTILGSYDTNGPNPYGYKWNSNMFSTGFGYLGENEIVFSQPRYNMILAYTGDPANTIFEPNRTANRERHKRFTLASACMGDGYYCVNGIGNFWYWWEPEYDLQLGWPTGPITQVVEPTGFVVWVRYFTNGEVWINPNGYDQAASGGRPAIAAYDAVFKQYALAAQPATVNGPRFESPTPNPMRASSTLRFALPSSAPATLQIFDVRGRLVKQVWSGVGTGTSQVAEWDGDTEMGFTAPRGIYFARLSSQGKKVEQRIVRM